MNIFLAQLDRLSKANITANTRESAKWFSKNVNDIQASQSDILKSGKKSAPPTKAGLMGKMFQYGYRATTDKLKYYDAFPLIIMVGPIEGGFHGLNLHYLPLPLRAALFDSLLGTINNTRYDDKTKLRINYSVLKNAVKYKYFKPSFKRYLTKNITSKVVEIPSSYWNIALYLPTENFKGASKSKVWSDSRKG